MFKFVGRFHTIKIDQERWTRDLNREMMKLLKEAMREFLEDVLTKVPVFSGMAQASLRPLAREISKVVPYHIDITPDPNWSLKKYPHRSIEQGEELGENTFKFHSKGRHVYVTIEPKVLHYFINEFFDVSDSFPLRHPVPWFSFQLGRVAWRQYMRKHLKKRVPKVSKFVARTEVKIT